MWNILAFHISSLSLSLSFLPRFVTVGSHGASAHIPRIFKFLRRRCLCCTVSKHLEVSYRCFPEESERMSLTVAVNYV